VFDPIVLQDFDWQDFDWISLAHDRWRTDWASLPGKVVEYVAPKQTEGLGNFHSSFVCTPSAGFSAAGADGSIERRMIEVMVQVHMTEAEIAGNFAAAMEKVRQGLEVVVEFEHQPIAVLKAADPPRRTIAEILVRIPKDSTGRTDEDFAADVAAAVEAHREPLDASKWD
jgi:hypothetical protein